MSSTPSDQNKDTIPIQQGSSSIPVAQILPEKKTAPNAIGSLLAERYRLEKTIGAGGMGEIYLALDEKLQRRVAIKMMLHPEDESDNKRFQLESQTVAGFSDPHTIRLFDYGITPEGNQYQVIEYIEGRNITEHLRNSGPLHPTIAKSIGIQLCGSLAEAHRKKILHRDIKPSNIMLIDSPERGVQCKLLDFGLARADNHDPTITKTGTVLGSPMYMSPEQIDSKSEDLTVHTDIYSLGLTLYTMVTGKQPFSGGSLSSVLAAQLFQDPKPLTELQPGLLAEPAFCWIIETAIQKQKDNRFHSIGQMKKAIELSLQNPHASLRLENDELFNDDEFVQSYTAISLESVSLALEAIHQEQQSKEQEHIDTIHQAKLNIPTKALETSLPWPWIIAVLAIVGGIGFWIQKTTQPAVYLTATEVTPHTLSTDNANAEITTPKPFEALTTVQIVTNPIGASVFLGEQYLGSTPMTVDLPNDTEQALVLKKEGYQDEELDWTPAISEINLSLQNQKKQPTPSKSIKPMKDVSPSTPTLQTPSKTGGVKKVTNPFEKR